MSEKIPLLQISIPTYNRSCQLRIMVQDLMQLSDLITQGTLVIAIFDNSDSDHAVENEKNVELIGSYLPNAENIGFGANVLRCLVESTGEFTWVISDDDRLNVPEIRNLVIKLSELRDRVDGIAVSCTIPILDDQRTQMCIGLCEKYGEMDCFKEVIDPYKLPFDYLGSFIIKSCLIEKNKVDELNQKNCYYQSLVYCTSVPAEATVFIYDQPVVKWVGSHEVRWSVASLIEARMEVIAAVQKNLGVSLNQAVLINEVLKWGVLSRAGFYKMPSTLRDTNNIIKHVINLKSVRSKVYLILYLLPSLLTKRIILLILKVKRQLRKQSI